MFDRASLYSWDLRSYCLFLLITRDLSLFSRVQGVSENLHRSDCLQLFASLTAFKQHSWEPWPPQSDFLVHPQLSQGNFSGVFATPVAIPCLWKAAVKPLWTHSSSLGNPPWKEAESSTFTGASIHPSIHQEVRAGRERQSAFLRF